MSGSESLRPPSLLFHVTTGRKVKAYRMTGMIHAPVRGFDTLMAAMAWAMKTGRKVIMRVECVTPAQLLPDHHNEWGKAWWTGDVPVDRMRCAYSAEGAWPCCSDTANASVTVAAKPRTVDAVLDTDGHCALCGQPATHVCHCPQCQDSLAEDGDNPDEGRPLCDKCGDDAVVSNTKCEAPNERNEATP